VKATPLLATPFTFTTTFPVVAPAGTDVAMLVALQLVTVAVVPLNVTVLVPCVDPKFAPVIVTAVPTGPEVGFRPVSEGAEPVFAGPELGVPAQLAAVNESASVIARRRFCVPVLIKNYLRNPNQKHIPTRNFKDANSSAQICAFPKRLIQLAGIMLSVARIDYSCTKVQSSDRSLAVLKTSLWAGRPHFRRGQTIVAPPLTCFRFLLYSSPLTPPTPR
jgi:hypothetical protein